MTTATTQQTTNHVSCTAIVCAYNEEVTLPAVLTVLLASPLVDEVIAVNDGSSDDTAGIVTRFAHHPQVRAIHFAENQGKGAAMAEAITQAGGDALLFVDADLLDLKGVHISALLEPLYAGEADMVIGLPVQGQTRTLGERLDPCRPLYGQRTLYRREALPLVDPIRGSRFGVETILNQHFRQTGRRTIYVDLWELVHPIKWDKLQPGRALREYTVEIWQILMGYVVYARFAGWRPSWQLPRQLPRLKPRQWAEGWRVRRLADRVSR